ncbi:hypothetical protein [Thermococcus sp.]|uniref:hypothetical protein n=1 Tax=Thermococcus sp. TaxID=35749 RepID=UPI0026204C2E|nr:hypothetical protein [Thermococcus sp.]
MDLRKLPFPVYSLLVLIVELFLGTSWKIVDLYMKTERIGGVPCVAFYCIEPSWVLALAVLLSPLLLGYLFVERWDSLREHAKTHLLFGLLVLPAGMCSLSSGGFLGVLYSNVLAAGLAYYLQDEHYRRNLPGLALVSVTWLFIGCVLALKPWAC